LINASSSGDAVRALEYIETSLLQAFPMVSMVWDFGGYGPIITDRRDTYNRLRLRAAKWPILSRASKIEEDKKANIFTNFTVRYDLSPLTRNYKGVVVRDRSNSDLCALAVEFMGGEHHKQPIEAPFVTSATVANYIIDWMVEHQTLPGYYVEYVTLPIVLFMVKRGDNVTITDENFGWVNVDATVELIEYSAGTTTLGLRVWWSYFQLMGASSSGSLIPDIPEAQ